MTLVNELQTRVEERKLRIKPSFSAFFFAKKLGPDNNSDNNPNEIKERKERERERKGISVLTDGWGW